MTLLHAYRSHAGLRRENNEDTLAALPEKGLWIVADGMGGHEQGEVASRLAVETICAEIESGKSLEAAIDTANTLVLSQPARNPGYGMGTTIVIAQTNTNRYRIAWVGDSRAYLWNGALTQLSTDHSYIQELMDAGELDAQDARTHPYRSMLTQALGITYPDELQIGIAEGELNPGDGLLLCTDGLTEELADEQIADCLAESGDAEATAQQLLDKSLDSGGKDNVTFIWLVAEAS